MRSASPVAGRPFRLKERKRFDKDHSRFTARTPPGQADPSDSSTSRRRPRQCALGCSILSGSRTHDRSPRPRPIKASSNGTARAELSASSWTRSPPLRARLALGAAAKGAPYIVLAASDPAVSPSPYRLLRREGVALPRSHVRSGSDRERKAGVDAPIAKATPRPGARCGGNHLHPLQRLLARVSPPVFAQGGIGLHTRRLLRTQTRL